MNEQEIKKRLREDLSRPPHFEEVWQFLKRKGSVHYVEVTPDRYDELQFEAKAFVEFQRFQLETAESSKRRSRDTDGEEATDDPDLEPYELQRSAVESLYFAREVGRRRKVKGFRETVLRGELLTPDEADRLVGSPAAAFFRPELFEQRRIPLVDHEAEIVEEQCDAEDYWQIKTTVVASPPGARITTSWYSHSLLYYADQSGDVRTVAVWRGSVLGTLLEVSEWIAERYPWSEAEASRFILTDDYPCLAPLTGREERGIAPSITLTVSPYVSADTVRRFYLRVQRQHPDRRAPQERAKSVAALRFVLEQTNGKGPTGEYGQWHELQALWNDTFPQWQYTARDGLSRAYERAYERIIAPRL